MLKRLVLAAAIACGASWVACADGLSPVYSTPALYNWSGLYVGAHVGWERGNVGGNSDQPQVLGPPSTYDQNVAGWLGGAQIGVNHQIGRTVIGVELSGTWGNVKGSSFAANVPSGPPAACLNMIYIGGFDVNCRAQQDWTGQLLVKAGYAIGDGRFLPYFTGGIALSSLDMKTSLLSSAGIFPPSTYVWGTQKLLVGGVLGGGVQYAFGNGISIGAEYLFTAYAGGDFTSDVTYPSLTVAPNREQHDLTTNTLRFVVNYKFGD
jgi:outer membrane immunogenic protein